MGIFDDIFNALAGPQGPQPPKSMRSAIFRYSENVRLKSSGETFPATILQQYEARRDYDGYRIIMHEDVYVDGRQPQRHGAVIPGVFSQKEAIDKLRAIEEGAAGHAKLKIHLEGKHVQDHFSRFVQAAAKPSSAEPQSPGTRPPKKPPQKFDL